MKDDLKKADRQWWLNKLLYFSLVRGTAYTAFYMGKWKLLEETLPNCSSGNTFSIWNRVLNVYKIFNYPSFPCCEKSYLLIWLKYLPRYKYFSSTHSLWRPITNKVYQYKNHCTCCFALIILFFFFFLYMLHICSIVWLDKTRTQSSWGKTLQQIVTGTCTL